MTSVCVLRAVPGAVAASHASPGAAPPDPARRLGAAHGAGCPADVEARSNISGALRPMFQVGYRPIFQVR